MLVSFTLIEPLIFLLNTNLCVCYRSQAEDIVLRSIRGNFLDKEWKHFSKFLPHLGGTHRE